VYCSYFMYTNVYVHTVGLMPMPMCNVYAVCIVNYPRWVSFE
jgi:hypothetical protein